MSVFAKNAAAKEVRSLLQMISAIRVLKYVSDAPVDNPKIIEGLLARRAAVNRPLLNRTLLGLRRRGWLKEHNSRWSITPSGRKALKLGVSKLKEIADLTDG